MSGKTNIHFLGAAGTVTGSKYLLETGNTNILIDCGLFQGLKELRLKNREILPINLKELDAVILTHAHLDHSGYLPILIKNGYEGDIFCTDPTKHLTEIILLDSAKIQEEDAVRANKYSYSKHQNAEPLYTQADVKRSLELIKTHEFNQWVIIDPSIKFEFLNNGHIIGSGFVNMKIQDETIVFSGDIGQLKPMLLYPPKKIKEADAEETKEKVRKEKEALKKAESKKRTTSTRRKSTAMNPIIKVLTSATFIRSVFGILNKVMKR